MIDAPEPLLSEGSDASAFERDLLRAGRQVEPAEGEVDRVWASFALRLPPPGAGGGGGDSGVGGPPPPAGNDVAVTALKGLGLGLGAGALVTAVWFVAAPPPVSQPPVVTQPIVTDVRSSEAAPRAPALPLPLVAEPAVRAPPGAPVRTAPPDVSQSAPTAIASSAPVPPASQLREESDLVRRARAALRSGDAAGALSLVAEGNRRFASGALAQEREAIAIEALAASGSKAEASRRARAFVAEHPDSPHAAQVEKIAP